MAVYVIVCLMRLSLTAAAATGTCASRTLVASGPLGTDGTITHTFPVAVLLAPADASGVRACISRRSHAVSLECRRRTFRPNRFGLVTEFPFAREEESKEGGEPNPPVS